MLSGALAGAAVGGLLGLLGGAIGTDGRAAVATLLGIAAVPIGISELRSGRACVVQRDRETPQRWLHRGPFVWATLNGAVLGAAFTTRLGFSLWYAVPVGAFVLGDPMWGAAVYGLFGAARTGGALAIVVADRVATDAERQTDRLFALRPTMQRLCGSALLALGVVVVIAAGV